MDFWWGILFILFVLALWKVAYETGRQDGQWGEFQRGVDHMILKIKQNAVWGYEIKKKRKKHGSS